MDPERVQQNRTHLADDFPKKNTPKKGQSLSLRQKAKPCDFTDQLTQIATQQARFSVDTRIHTTGPHW
jgi:hypothetical protein